MDFQFKLLPNNIKIMLGEDAVKRVYHQGVVVYGDPDQMRGVIIHQKMPNVFLKEEIKFVLKKGETHKVNVDPLPVHNMVCDKANIKLDTPIPNVYEDVYGEDMFTEEIKISFKKE